MLFASQQRLRSLSPPSCRNPAAAGGRDGYVEGGYGLGWYGGRPCYCRPFGAYGGSSYQYRRSNKRFGYRYRTYGYR